MPRSHDSQADGADGVDDIQEEPHLSVALYPHEPLHAPRIGESSRALDAETRDRAAIRPQPARSALRRPRSAQSHRIPARRIATPKAIADLGRSSGQQAAAGLEDARERVGGRDGLDPALEERERDVDGREEERQEDRDLHHRPGLHRPEPHRDPAGPQDAGEVHEQRQAVEAEEVDPVTADLHSADERDHGQHRGGHEPAEEGGDRVADDDAAPVRRGEQEPAREAALEVPGDSEAGEDAAERGRLEQHEDELEARVARPVLEARARPRRARARPRTR